jgi:hypothetical protein
MTIDEIKDYMSVYFWGRQEKFGLEIQLGKFSEQYGDDVDLDIVTTECAFCEFEGLSIIPTNLLFPVNCPDCGENQLYVQGTFQCGEC